VIQNGQSTCKSPTGIAPVIQVHPIRRCNLACMHCYSGSGPAAEGQVDQAILAACLRDAAALGYRQLAVSGGEPLLYPYLPQLLSQARELGMLTSLTTNGMLATPSRWERIGALLDVAAISIDGKPEEHDTMRGQRGAFEKTIANLGTIGSSGTVFGFIFTLTRHNLDSLEFVVRLAADHGARSVQVHPLTQTGRAAESLADAGPDGMELIFALLEADRLGRQLGVAVHVDALSREQLQIYRSHLVPERPVRSLASVSPVLVVQPDATVVPLTHEVDSGFYLGSLNQRALGTLSRNWLESGRGDRLALTCERTWDSLNESDWSDSMAVYWYSEVAARTRALSLA
jgi:MoaA/NifB/PqqE/SkfB family radical SAM enzyme